ncbi:hypothetical protein, partial [Paenibacillus polymyxa]|uniref:hypothetical protein n=1 Tax=Paenibacillus polymyxa TaxID=1406 RepID=UPI0006BF7E7E
MTKQQDEVRKQNESLKKMVASKQITAGEFEKQIRDNNAKIAEFDNSIQEKRVAVFNSNLGESADKLGRQLEVTNAQLEGLDEHSPEYQKVLVNQISLYTQQSDITRKTIDDLTKMIASEKLSAKNKEEYIKQQEELNQKLLEYQNAIR